MAQRVDRGRIRRRVHALAAITVALSFLVVSVAETSHSHAGSDSHATESAADCAVCQFGKKPGHTTGPHTPDLTGSDVHQAPAIAGHRPVPAVLHFSPHRSRAPPLAVSM